jgi:hypothetical protein
MGRHLGGSNNEPASPHAMALGCAHLLPVDFGARLRAIARTLDPRVRQASLKVTIAALDGGPASPSTVRPSNWSVTSPGRTWTKWSSARHRVLGRPPLLAGIDAPPAAKAAPFPNHVEANHALAWTPWAQPPFGQQPVGRRVSCNRPARYSGLPCRSRATVHADVAAVGAW